MPPLNLGALFYLGALHQVLGCVWAHPFMTWVHASVLDGSGGVFSPLLSNKKSTWLYLDHIFAKKTGVPGIEGNCPDKTT